MTAFSNIPPQAVLPLGAYRLDELERDARRADQRCLRADCAEATDKPSVLARIGRDFGFPAHYGVNLDALYDCVTDLPAPDEAAQPGFLVILQNLPDTPAFGVAERAALLDVFRDAADYHFDHGTAFRVFYSIRKGG
jgi:RNAse (barnase) inhibitor barstar